MTRRPLCTAINPPFTGRATERRQAFGYGCTSRLLRNGPVASRRRFVGEGDGSGLGVAATRCGSAPGWESRSGMVRATPRSATKTRAAIVLAAVLITSIIPDAQRFPMERARPPTFPPRASLFEPATKPGSVRRRSAATSRWPSIYDVRCRTPLAVHPGACWRAANPLLDLAPDGVYLAAPVTRHAGELLPHPFTLAGEPRRLTDQIRLGGLLSVALATGRPAWAFTQRPALWSPDFPRRLPKQAPRPPGRLRIASTIMRA